MSSDSSAALIQALSGSPTPVFVLGHDMAIYYANPAAGALLGFDAAALVGQALSIPFTVGVPSDLDILGAGGVAMKVRVDAELASWDGRPVSKVSLTPYAPVAAPAAPAPAPAPRPAPSAGGQGNGERILVLEDDLSIGDIQGRMLKSLGYATEWAKTGEEAIDMCKKALHEGKRFSAGLFDLTIQGGMGGQDAMKAIRSIDPALKAIACSGYSDDEFNAKLIAEGFNDVLPKPFRSAELGKVLKRNLT